MRTIMRKKDGSFIDQETGFIVREEDILQMIKKDELFKITDEETGKDITNSELAQILIRQTRSKSDTEKILQNLKKTFETGKESLAQVLQDMLFIGYGALVTTEQKLRETIDQMVESGKLSKEKGEELFSKTKENLQAKEKEAETKIREAIRKMVTELGVAFQDDMDKKFGEVEKELKKLRSEINKLSKKVDKAAGQ